MILITRRSIVWLFLLYLLFFSIIILPNSSFSEIYISKVYNKINVLNLHGNRFFLNEEAKIKSGDYLSTREKPATIIFQDNTKLCFSSNSSLKILKNKNIINFEFTKGSILFSINKKSYEHYNLNFFLYNLENIKDIIILSKKNKLEIIIKIILFTMTHNHDSLFGGYLVKVLCCNVFLSVWPFRWNIMCW